MVDAPEEQSVVELARDATQVRRPATALRAVTVLRERLDEIEAFHVESAIARGWSWGQVAAPLGVTRQAAHKRHARRLGTGGRVTVTAAAQRVVQRALEEAIARGHRAVRAPHLLLALRDPDSGRAAIVLKKLRVGAKAVSAELAPGTPRRTGAHISPEARRAFEQSLREAVRAGSERLEPEHLLLALARQSGGAAARVLASVGASDADVERLLGLPPSA